MDIESNNNAEAIIKSTAALTGAEVHVLDENERYAILPEGKRVESLKSIIDQFREKPERRKGTITLTTEASFIDMLKRFADPALTAVFAKRDFKEPSLLAVFDYHRAGEADVDKAEWLSHRARYPFPLSKEWKRWFEKNEVVLEVTDFAAFIEDNIRDIATLGTEPAADAEMRELAQLVEGTFASPSQLMDLSRGLQINVNSQLKQALKLSSGEISLTYQEVHNDGEGRPIRVPNLFIVGIPIFDGGPRYRIPARLRYRMKGPAIAWSYSLVQPERSFDHAFDEVVARVKEAVSVPVFYGAPES